MCTKCKFITFVDTPQNYFCINFGVLQNILTFIFNGHTANLEDGYSMYGNQVIHDLFLKTFEYPYSQFMYTYTYIYACKV